MGTGLAWQQTLPHAFCSLLALFLLLSLSISSLSHSPLSPLSSFLLPSSPTLHVQHACAFCAACLFCLSLLLLCLLPCMPCLFLSFCSAAFYSCSHIILHITSLTHDCSFISAPLFLHGLSLISPMCIGYSLARQHMHGFAFSLCPLLFSPSLFLFPSSLSLIFHFQTWMFLSSLLISLSFYLYLYLFIYSLFIYFILFLFVCVVVLVGHCVLCSDVD